MNSRGSLIVLVGPSGCGKGTVLKEFLRKKSNTLLSVSVTTRAPRPGEEEGVNYFFVTREQYDDLLKKGGLLEHAIYVGNGYGTPREPVMRHMDQGENVILEIEMQGARQIKALYPEALLIFILPPSMEELRERLRGRGTESPEVVEQRLKTALQELPFADECDYVIVNDAAEGAAERLKWIIRARECSRKNMRPVIDALLRETEKMNH